MPLDTGCKVLTYALKYGYHKIYNSLNNFVLSKVSEYKYKYIYIYMYICKPILDVRPCVRSEMQVTMSVLVVSNIYTFVSARNL